MNYFKVGTDFNLSLIDEVKKLNEKYEGKSKVSEFYGSIRKHSDVSARPSFRLPDRTLEELEEFVKKANEIGVSVNYTLNSMVPYKSKIELENKKNEFVNLIHYLEKIGVKLVTVANPILLEILKDIKTSLKIEISTCAHIDTLTQIKYYKDMYNISKVCGNVLKNRNFTFLMKANKLCESIDVTYELMVNEFCGVGGEGYATHCIYRDSCYICHALNETHNDMQLLGNYPMDMCTNSRNIDKSNWLKSQFIRPEDLKVYRDVTGINHFKITGRTASLDYQVKMLNAYMAENFEGDLLELWKPLETITKENNSDSVDYKIINNKDLEGFVNQFAYFGKDCSIEVCGETCKYCNKFYEKISKEEI